MQITARIHRRSRHAAQFRHAAEFYHAEKFPSCRAEVRHAERSESIFSTPPLPMRNQIPQHFERNQNNNRRPQE